MNNTTSPSSSVDTNGHDRGTKRLIAGTTLAIISLVAGFGGWAAITNIRSAVIASGKVIVEGSAKKVQHAEGGIIGELLVKEGDRVVAGQVILRLDATKTRAELTIVRQRLFDLVARKSRLRAERDDKAKISFPRSMRNISRNRPSLSAQLSAQQRLLTSNRMRSKSQLGQVRARIAQLRNEVKGLHIQKKAKTSELSFIRNDIKRYKSLERKRLISITKINDKRRMYARITGERGKVSADIARVKGQISEMQIKSDEIKNGTIGQILNELNQLGAQIAELSQRKITALDQLSRIDIKAPSNGRVHELAVHTIGGIIAPGDVLMKVVPDNGNLIIEARVMTTDIDEVHIGKLARIRFSAFSQRTTPELSGRVMTVSPDQSIDQQTGAAYYTARIALKQGERSKLAGKTLIPGMPSDVMLVGENRTVLNYLIKPLADQLTRAFREG